VSGHPIVLNIKKTEQPRETTDEQPKITKLAIGVEGGIPVDAGPKYTYATEVYCVLCKSTLKLNAKLTQIVEAVLKAESANKPDPASWEEQARVQCDHTAKLKQLADCRSMKSRDVSHCESCDKGEDLWLCMTCGALGCSRKDNGGNGHAVAHNAQSGHPVVLKVGTITPEGTADMYCYGCSEMRLDPLLAQHLQVFGIRVEEQVKTAMSMEEKSLAANMNRKWDAVLEEGKEAELVFGPGNTGLDNLGNSCYMSSVVQCLFTLPSFQRRYYVEGRQHLLECRNNRPAECFMCQMSKLGCGLHSGKYSKAPSEEMMELWNRKKPKIERKQKEEKSNEGPQKPLQPGIKPRMFKKFIGKDHPEFKGTRQQDAHEFLQYFLTQIQQKERAGGADPTAVFNLQLEERHECNQCHQVKYASVKDSQIALPVVAVEDTEGTEKLKKEHDKLVAAAKEAGKPEPKKFDDKAYFPTTLEKCWGAWSESSLEAKCTTCKKVTSRKKSTRFTVFPDVLVVQMQRFVYTGWVPAKMEIDIVVDEQMDLSGLKAKGLQAGEKEMPSDSPAGGGGGSAAAEPKRANAEQVATVESMGFTKNQATRAVLAVENNGAERAIEWLMAHLDDANINDPIEAPKAAAAGGAAKGGDDAPADVVANLMGMGFDERRCRHALKQCGNNAERAVDWLFSHADDPIPDASSSAAAGKDDSKANTACKDPKAAKYRLSAFITHLGKSATTGHYVCHILREGKWVLFNDSKVSISEKPPKYAGYVYFFRRVPS